MIPTPTEILARIQTGTLLPPDVIQTLDHDSILDSRDGDAEFESQWKRCYDEIDVESSPDFKRSEFKLVLYEK